MNMENKKFVRKFALSIAALLALGTASIAAKNSQTIGTVKLSGWEELQLTGNTISASGSNLELKTTDGRFYAKAKKMVVTLYEAPKGLKLPADRMPIKRAEFTGGVTFSAKPDAVRSIKGSGSKLSVIGEEQKAVLDGEGKTVKVEAMDPVIFEKPSQINADKVTINLKSKLGPDDWRIKMESDPAKSHLEVTPKPTSESTQP